MIFLAICLWIALIHSTLAASQGGNAVGWEEYHSARCDFPCNLPLDCSDPLHPGSLPGWKMQLDGRNTTLPGVVFLATCLWIALIHTTLAASQGGKCSWMGGIPPCQVWFLCNLPLDCSDPLHPGNLPGWKIQYEESTLWWGG